MFFSNYPRGEELKTMWSSFAKQMQNEAPITRWGEVVNTNNKNVYKAVLAMDEIIYDFYRKTFNEESEKTIVPYMVTIAMNIIARNAIMDYEVEMDLPPYEFTNYMQSTRLCTVLTRTKDDSEMPEDFSKYSNVLTETFPNEELTLWDMFMTEEECVKFESMCHRENEELGIPFIDSFFNMVTFDFVRNYLNLPNERNVKYYNLEENESGDYDISLSCGCVC